MLAIEEIIVNEEGTRLDKFLSSISEEISRSLAEQIIAKGNVKVNEEIVTTKNLRLKLGDKIVVSGELIEKDTSYIKPKDIELDAVYEDEHLLVLNKPAGLTVHPGAGNHDDTLVNALVHHYGTNFCTNGGKRPGIVHRLDRDTTGLMLVAKTGKVHRKLSKQIELKEVKRIYKAICYGSIMPSIGTIKINIDRDPSKRTRMRAVQNRGKESITDYKVLRYFKSMNCSLVQCKLHTGRTHQIRVHMDFKGHPILGDKVYGKSYNHPNISEELKAEVTNLGRQALHASSIDFKHPITLEPMSFTAELPADMQKLVEFLK